MNDTDSKMEIKQNDISPTFVQFLADIIAHQERELKQIERMQIRAQA